MWSWNSFQSRTRSMRRAVDRQLAQILDESGRLAHVELCLLSARRARRRGRCASKAAMIASSPRQALRLARLLLRLSTRL